MQFLKKLTSQEVKIERFFALNLSDEKIQAAVWQVEDGKTAVVKLGSSQTWDGKTNESLLKAVDESISQASIGMKPEPEKIIFGLPDSWVEQDKVNQDKKVFLKILSEKLGLKPLGFVATDSALISYLKHEEGAPLSTVLIQVSSAEINVTLVKLGKVLGSQLVGRSGDLGADTEEALSRFPKLDALPARIILYNGGGNIEEDKQQLLSYDWEDKLPFIHFPKVESLPADFSIKAVALAGGSEVAQSLGILVDKPEPKIEQEKAEADAAAFGFVSGEDVAETKKVPVIPEPKPEKPTKNWQPKIRPNFNYFLNQFKGKLPFARAPLAIGAGVGLVIIGSLLYWNLPKAKITIYLTPQKIHQELELSLDTAINQAEGLSLPITEINKTLSGNKQTATTGVQTIGDPARGQVTVFNKTSAAKTFSKGTIMLGGGNLAFSLDSETTVASRSAEEDGDGVITITPGKAEAEITAVNIGSDSNLPPDSRLSFKQYSEDDYYAKTAGLAGGSSNEVKAVDSEDIESLEAELLRELILQAETEIKSSLSQDQVLIDNYDQLELNRKEFSAEEDEAADELSLKAELEYRGIIYRQAQFDQILKEAIKTKVPENFIISGFTDLQLGAVEQMQLPISYEATLLPRLDLAEIKKNLSGKYPDKVENYLDSLPQFVSADIQIAPNLPKFLKTFPRITKNINIEIKPAP